MIAPNDKQAGRNDPCPCGSGEKYKRCCMADGTPHLEPKDMKTVLAAALLQISKLTGTACFIIPESVFEGGALDAVQFNAQYDEFTKAWRFRVEPPKEQIKKVIGARRIVLPNRE